MSKKYLFLIYLIFILVIISYSEGINFSVILNGGKIVESERFHIEKRSIYAQLIDSDKRGFLYWEFKENNKVQISVFFPLNGETYYVGKSSLFYSFRNPCVIRDRRFKRLAIFNKPLNVLLETVRELIVKEKDRTRRTYLNTLYFLLTGNYTMNKKIKNEFIWKKVYTKKYCSECSEELKLCDAYNKDKYDFCIQKCDEIGGDNKEQRSCKRMCLKLSMEGFRNCWSKYHECRMKCTPDPK